jgi:hypothetical protein
MKRWWMCLVLILFFTTAHAPLLLGEGPSYFIKKGVKGEISYLSGGVGLEERRILESMAKGYNLKLVFAMSSGEYLSDLSVILRDKEGRTLLHTVSNGPWFFAKLPVGVYTVTVSVGDLKQQRQVQVGKDLTTVIFQWAP